jgi:hypothetical protein
MGCRTGSGVGLSEHGKARALAIDSFKYPMSSDRKYTPGAKRRHPFKAIARINLGLALPSGYYSRARVTLRTVSIKCESFCWSSVI